MPNFCANRFSAAGPTTAIRELTAAVSRGIGDARACEAAELLAGDDKAAAARIADVLTDESELLTFAAHVSCPDGVADVSGWRRRHWGCAYDAEGTQLFHDGECGVTPGFMSHVDTIVQLTFLTTWLPPEAWFAAVAAAHPTLRMELLWNEEQGTAGVFTAEHGAITSSDAVEPPSRLVSWFGWNEAPHVEFDFDDPATEPDGHVTPDENELHQPK